MSVIQIDNKPTWNFSDTTAYPVQIQQRDNTERTVYVYLSPYKANELKNILSNIVAGYRRDNKDVSIVREDRAVYTPLFDAHFIKLGNATGTPEAQKAWLDNKHPELKPVMVEHTFGGLKRSLLPSSEDDNGPLDIVGDLDQGIPVYQSLYDPDTDTVVKVEMLHRYTQPSEAQFRRYRSARQNKFLRKKAIWTVIDNYDILSGLYDEVVTAVDGTCTDAGRCTESTKSKWIGDIPLWHKIWIVDQIFADLIEKND